MPHPARIIAGGHDNKTARTVAIYEDEAINESAFAAIFDQIVANNRAGGWRKLQDRPELTGDATADPRDRSFGGLLDGGGAAHVLTRTLPAWRRRGSLDHAAASRTEAAL